MDNLPASEPLRGTVGANRNPANNCDRSTTDGSTFQSYHVRPIDSSNNYLSSDQDSVVYLHFPDCEHHPVTGFQGNQNQPSGTYQATIDGHAQTFTSLRALLQIQSLIDNFRDRTIEYLPGFDIPPEDNEIKTLILENECVQQVFLLVNEIEILNVSGSADQLNYTEQASGGDRSGACHLPAPRSDRRRSVSRENHPFSGVDHTPQYYSCHVNGEDKTFDSIDELLAEQTLLRNFRDNARLYNVVSDIPVTDADLKNFVNKRQERIAAFLLINDIKKTVPTANAGCSANYVTACDREPTAGIFNQRMASVTERQSSLVLHNVRRDVEFLHNIPPIIRNTFNLSAAGFYLSLKEEKLFCFSCGGSIEEWLEEWRTSTLDEVHATLYPECSFLRENVGIGFIEDCQQQLTPEQQRRLARPLESHPHLYSLPVSDHQWQQELNARSVQETMFNLREDRTLVDGMTVHEIARENRQLTRCVQQHWGCQHQPGAYSAIDSNVQRCLEDFHRRFLPDSALHYEMDRLHGKVNAARDPNNQLKLSLLQILENLLTLPEDQWADTGAEIAGMIDAAYDHDCQDHTSEIIDQIKTRMAFINIKRELEVGPDAIEIFDLLKKLKLFFNESVLYKVMSTTRRMDGTPLVAAKESTEIRGYIKNQLSRSLCLFPENHILQRFGTLGSLPPKTMDEVQRKFLNGIMNKADFLNYIVDMFNTEPELLELLRRRNVEFSVWHGKTESNSELLMEQYTDLPGLSEQEIIEGAANVANSRRRFMNDDIYQFIDVKLDMFWSRIKRETRP